MSGGNRLLYRKGSFDPIRLAPWLRFADWFCPGGVAHVAWHIVGRSWGDGKGCIP